MNQSTILILIGVVCIIGPGLIALIEGCDPAREDDDSDLIHWLMGKRLDQIFTMQGLQMSGVFFVTAGLGLMGMGR